MTYLQLVAVGMLFAFAAAAIAEAFLVADVSARTGPSTFDGRPGRWRRILKGVGLGPVLNLCSACVAPVSSTLRRGGMGVEEALALVHGSATPNVPSLLMIAVVFTPLLGASRLVLGLVAALSLGPLVAWAVRRRGARLQAGLVHRGQGRGVVHLDYDNDGDQDLVIFNNGGLPTLVRNELDAGTDGSGRWLRVFLDTAARADLAPDGFGSLVAVRTGDLRQVRYVGAAAAGALARRHHLLLPPGTHQPHPHHHGPLTRGLTGEQTLHQLRQIQEPCTVGSTWRTRIRRQRAPAAW